MTHQYKLTGLTCGGCEASVRKILSQLEGIQSIQFNAARDEATIEMANHISTNTLKSALANYPKYTIEDKIEHRPTPSVSMPLEEAERTWFETYKPLLTVFAYITGISFLAAWQDGSVDAMRFMQIFMAGFFIAFSFFKMLDLAGFADSYSMYDLLAKQWKGYGYIYPFIELALGLAYIVNFNPFLTNIVTIIVMGFSVIGVLQSVLNKRKIRCACLGTGFNLPMTTVTIIEDLLMIIMAAAMLYFM